MAKIPAMSEVSSDSDRLAYSPGEVSRKIDLPYSTVLRLIKDGELHAVRAGRHYRVSRQALDDFLGCRTGGVGAG